MTCSLTLRPKRRASAISSISSGDTATQGTNSEPRDISCASSPSCPKKRRTCKEDASSTSNQDEEDSDAETGPPTQKARIQGEISIQGSIQPPPVSPITRLSFDSVTGDFSAPGVSSDPNTRILSSKHTRSSSPAPPEQPLQQPVPPPLWAGLDEEIEPLFTILDTAEPTDDTNTPEPHDDDPPKRKRGAYTSHASKYHLPSHTHWAARTTTQSPHDYTLPALFADHTFKRGSRFIPPQLPKGCTNKFGHPIPGPAFDQATLLVLKLLDTRIDPRTGEPRNTPVVVRHPVPRDWSCRATIRQLNIDRAQNIRRITGVLQRKVCVPYETEEREWIAREKDKSTSTSTSTTQESRGGRKGARRDLEARFNARFEGKLVGNYWKPREGRSRASLDAEYNRAKRWYDVGAVPPETAKAVARDDFGWREQRVLHAMLNERPMRSLDDGFVEAYNASGATVHPRSLAQLRKEQRRNAELYERPGYVFPSYPPKGAVDNFCLAERKCIAEVMGKEPEIDMEKLVEMLNERFEGEVLNGDVRVERTAGSVKLEVERFGEAYRKGEVPVEMRAVEEMEVIEEDEKVDAAEELEQECDNDER
ncbi:uncharacterized protein BDZ99DRAFT_568921 [Mytilinidion resinicola]|uniref:Uncharacterized protein n=1 Tax=Mytilinidion resinicola TaxID=574789 RepID=A0A6A6YUJ2_9PEZI|nr:uncharacterized protein BDZ99DRAFT_568921 [Mytilinidion resinicola]KAF2812189.1 hypothetical protein BDZ99DRAFT_568921 [Mytilinidion resinicola]